MTMALTVQTLSARSKDKDLQTMLQFYTHVIPQSMGWLDIDCHAYMLEQ
jgi:hypothetical protein